MKRYRLLMMAVLLTLVGRTLADNLSVANVEINAGETKQVAIVLNNPDHQYAAFQFDLVLPDGVSIAKNEKGKLIASLNDDRKDDHTLTVTDVGSNTYRFLSFSMTNAEYYGTGGTLVNVTLQVATGISAGSKTVTVKSQVFTEVSGTQYTWGDTTFNVAVGGGSSDPDVPEPPVAGNDMLTVEAVSMSAGETKQVALVLKNPDHQYAAFQFDLVLPEGMSIAKNEKGKFIASLNDDRKDDHTLTVTDVGSNTYRFLSFSMTNAEYYGKSGPLVYVTLQAAEGISEGVKTATIQSQVFTEVIGTQHDWDDKSFQITIEAPIVPVTVTAKNYTREYGDANPAFEFTSEGATLNGTPEVTCEATATSPVGTYPIVIKKGSVTNSSDTYVNGTLTITKAPLTISGGTYTMKQGDALPTFKATYSGFKNGETEAVLTKKPTLTTTATSSSAPGTYDVTVSGAEAKNYDIKYVKGTLTITDADPITVTVKSVTREYGDANPTFEYTVEGGTLDGTPEISCAATQKSDVGTYDITIAKGTVKNYNVTFVGGKLTITKAPLTIGGGTYTMKQGDALPTFKATYSGFKNGETEAVLTKKPTLTTTVTSSSVPGKYKVTASGAEAKNYEITYEEGSLTVTAAEAVVVTAKSYTREYGDANPVFEFTSEGATLNGTPEITCEATVTSPVGTYPIVIKKGSVTNYNDSYVNGTLTITKAPLTISAGGYTMKYGGAIPTFKATYSGFKNGETEAILTKKPTLTTTATSSSSPGTYEVTVSGAEAKNYKITYKNGTLKILGEVEFDGICYYLYPKKKEASVIQNPTKYSGSINVPEKITIEGIDYMVTAIAGSSFESCEKLKTITIPNSVTFIDSHAFYGCSGLTSVTIPSNVTCIGDCAFADCSSMTSVTIPSSVTSFGRSAFSGCSGLSSIKVESGNPKYDSRNDCNAIIETATNMLVAGCKNTIIPISVTSIGESAFYGCADLTSIIIPKSVTSIGGSAFWGCTSLESITIPKCVTSIGEFAFCDCVNLTSFISEIENPFEISNTVFLYRIAGSFLPKPTLIVPNGMLATYQSTKCWNMFSNIVEQGDGLIIEPITIAAGESKEVAIVLSNPIHQYNSFNFYLTLPSGISMEKATFNKERINGYKLIVHNIHDRDVKGNVYALTWIGYPTNEMTGTDGPIIYATLNADENLVESTKIGKLSYQEFWDENGTVHQWAEKEFLLTIETAKQVTLTANSYTRAYGEDNPTFKYTKSGAILIGKPDISCEATKTSPVGTYPIVIQKGSVTNDNDTYVNGTLTITKAPLTIKVGAYTRKQGEENPKFTLTYEGFKNGETESVLTKKPTVTTMADLNSPVGVYDVYASGAEAQNYEISYVAGTLTVEKRPKGDLDAKGYTDVTDVVAAINHILGEKTLKDVEKDMLDMNDDGELNVGDVILLVKAILEQGNVVNVPVMARGEAENIDLTKYTAMQLTMNVSAGCNIREIRLAGSNSSTHKLAYQQTGDGCYTVVVYSMGNQTFKPVGGNLLEVDMDGDGEPTTANVLLATPTGERTFVSSLPIGTVTGISIVGTEQVATGSVYDLRGNKVLDSGVPLKRLPKGVYILNGKKIIR